MKKWIAGVAGLLMVAALAGCSSGNTAVANMKGAKITKDDFYEKMKTSPVGGETVLRNMIVQKALDTQYGEKVSTKKVNAQYNKVKKSYTDAGQNFTAALASSGLTAQTFKDQIRTSLLSQAALKDLKKPTKKELKAQWDAYTPKITVQHILVDNEDKAKELIATLQANNTEEEFNKLAKENSTDTATAEAGGKLAPFDNTDTALDATFRKAALAMKEGEVSPEPVKTSYGFHVIRVIKAPAKGKYEAHVKDLTNQIYTKWESDETVMTKIIAKVLTKANVAIKDKDLQNVLADYLGSSSSSSAKKK